MTTLRGLESWKALAEHAADLKNMTLKQMFEADAGRGTRMTAEAEGVFLDYSKNRANGENV